MQNESERSPDLFEPKFKNKTEYFNDLALRYLPELRVLLKGGKLTRRDSEGRILPKTDRANWFNVTEHCLVQVAASENLASALGLTEDEKQKLCTAAGVHDWDKRLERKPDQFSPADHETVNQLLQNVNPDKLLLSATKADFLERSLVKNDATFLEKLQYYIDLLCDESAIIPFKERLNKARPRYPKLCGPDWAKKTGASWAAAVAEKLSPDQDYFDAAIMEAESTQQEIFKHLTERGVAITAPDEVPAFIKKLIEKNYLPEQV
jgi:hypothetical protein